MPPVCSCVYVFVGQRRCWDYFQLLINGVLRPGGSAGPNTVRRSAAAGHVPADTQTPGLGQEPPPVPSGRAPASAGLWGQTYLGAV